MQAVTREEAIAALLHDAPEDQGGLQTLNEMREPGLQKLHNVRATLADLRSIGNAVWGLSNAGRDATLENYEHLVEAYRSMANTWVERVARDLADVVAPLRRESDSLEKASQQAT